MLIPQDGNARFLAALRLARQIRHLDAVERNDFLVMLAIEDPDFAPEVGAALSLIDRSRRGSVGPRRLLEERGRTLVTAS